jgi:N-formylglutamate amidohydrolase
VLVLETRELARGVALGKTVDFLGLPRTEVDPETDRNVGAYAPPEPEIEQRLRDYFAPHNARLVSLLERRFDWPAPS